MSLRTFFRALLGLALVTLTTTPAYAQFTGLITYPTNNATVAQPILILGWAFYTNTNNNVGVDVVDVYGCPVSNCATPTFWGTAEIGIPRSEVAAQYGNQYLNSGFKLVMSGLPPGVPHYVKVYARNATNSQQWSEMVHTFTPASVGIFGINSPTHLQSVTQPVSFVGWAIDGASPTGTGVTAIDLWDYPNPGSGTAPVYLGAATYGIARSGVAQLYGSRFLNSGYSASKSGMVAGEHQFLVYANSAVNGWFINVTTNYVDLPTATLTIDRQGTGTGGITATGLTCTGGAATQAVPCSANYAFNTVRTLTAVPDAGSTFLGWGGVCAGTGTCQVTMSNAKFVRATFAKNASGFTVEYYHTDVIGTVRARTNSGGGLVAGSQHDPDPFGEDSLPVQGTNRLHFAGKELDAETQQHYFAARYFRQAWGRFTQVDPLHVGAAMTDPQQWNRYAYARNNPIAYGDPTGLSVIGFGAGAVLNALCSFECITVTAKPLMVTRVIRTGFEEDSSRHSDAFRSAMERSMRERAARKPVREPRVIPAARTTQEESDNSTSDGSDNDNKRNNNSDSEESSLCEALPTGFISGVGVGFGAFFNAAFTLDFSIDFRDLSVSVHVSTGVQAGMFLEGLGADITAGPFWGNPANLTGGLSAGAGALALGVQGGKGAFAARAGVGGGVLKRQTTRGGDVAMASGTFKSAPGAGAAAAAADPVLRALVPMMKAAHNACGSN